MKIKATYIHRNPSARHSYMILTTIHAWRGDAYKDMYKVIKFTSSGLEYGGSCKWDVISTNHLDTWVEVPLKSVPSPVRKATTFILNQINA